jgi:glycosyltransferase involved in cell wall biosynthesis
MLEVSGPNGLRVMVIAHSFVVPSNRARWERLAERHPDADVTLVTPDIFRTDRYGAEQVFAVAPEERGNYRVVPLPTTGRGLYRSFTLGIRQARPHVVQVNEEPTEWVLLQGFLAARALMPRAFRLFYYYTNILSPPDKWHRRAKHQAIFRLADGAIAGSTESERVLRDLGFRKTVHIQTEIGADERVWVPRDYAARHDTPAIGYVGALLPEKGVADLAGALVAVPESWRLVIAGDGPERPKVERILDAAGLSARLDFRGLVDRAHLPLLMRELDILVLPSRTTSTWKEQFGLVLPEAMLSGVAVIGSDSGAIPEVIGDSGLVFPEGDRRALSTAISDLRDNPRRREDLARRGRTRALRMYSASALAEDTYELCRGIVGE